MKRFNLITNYYVCQDSLRQREIDFCLSFNAANSEIDRVVILLAEGDLNAFDTVTSSEKVKKIICKGRPTYNDFFRATQDFKEDINAISNSDIFFDEENVMKLKRFEWQPKTCFALSRWEIMTASGGSSMFEEATPIEVQERKYSQDSWVFYGSVPCFGAADFPLGMPGCDNSIAFHLKNIGYQLSNPSLDVRTYHYHTSNARTYESNIPMNRIPLPYLKVYPCRLGDVGKVSVVTIVRDLVRKAVFYYDLHPMLFRFLKRGSRS